MKKEMNAVGSYSIMEVEDFLLPLLLVHTE